MKQRNYKATGIILKGMPMGESDRLVTVLTKEQGLIRAIAPGARKHKSKLAGRSGLFVVNDLFFSKGKSLDKLIQAETIRSFPGLSKDLAKLTASQYLAEIVLSLALSDHPQPEIYYLLIEHLGRIEAADKPNVLACLAQATFHLLATAGVAPDVFRCCISRAPLTPDISDPDWQVGFSVSAGGAVIPAEIERIEQEKLKEISDRTAQQEQERIEVAKPLYAASAADAQRPTAAIAAETTADYRAEDKTKNTAKNTAQTTTTHAARRNLGGLKTRIARDVTRHLGIVTYLNAAEIALMQQLNKPELILTSALPMSTQFTQKSGTIEGVLAANRGNLQESGPHLMWRHIEKALREYAQHQLDRPIRSAALIDTCFTSPSYASPA
ncbi:MAG: DNA repair protein RecO [Cyanobacteria bacterium J06643_4]